MKRQCGRTIQVTSSKHSFSVLKNGTNLRVRNTKSIIIIMKLHRTWRELWGHIFKDEIVFKYNFVWHSKTI